MTEIDKITKDSWIQFQISLGPKDGEEILAKIHCPIEEFFDEQKHIDRARKELFKPEFNHVLRLYLSRVDLHTLSAKMKEDRKSVV